VLDRLIETWKVEGSCVVVGEVEVFIEVLNIILK